MLLNKHFALPVDENCLKRSCTSKDSSLFEGSFGPFEDSEHQSSSQPSSEHVRCLYRLRMAVHCTLLSCSHILLNLVSSIKLPSTMHTRTTSSAWLRCHASVQSSRICETAVDMVMKRMKCSLATNKKATEHKGNVNGE